MGQTTKINGTAYDIIGGRTLIGGTGYNIKKGRTLIGGTGYDINFNVTYGNVTITGTLPESQYADWSLQYDGVSYRSGSFSAVIGDTIDIVQSVTTNQYVETSINVNGTWVLGEGGWLGVTGPVTYNLTLTNAASVSFTSGGSGVVVYIEIYITM